MCLPAVSVKGAVQDTVNPCSYTLVMSTAATCGNTALFAVCVCVCVWGFGLCPGCV